MGEKLRQKKITYWVNWAFSQRSRTTGWCCCCVVISAITSLSFIATTREAQVKCFMVTPEFIVSFAKPFDLPPVFIIFNTTAVPFCLNIFEHQRSRHNVFIDVIGCRILQTMQFVVNIPGHFVFDGKWWNCCCELKNHDESNQSNILKFKRVLNFKAF